MRAEATVRKGSNLPFRGKGGKVRNRRVSLVAPRPGEVVSQFEIGGS
jgi:hypothetical protein